MSLSDTAAVLTPSGGVDKDTHKLALTGAHTHRLSHTHTHSHTRSLTRTVSHSSSLTHTLTHTHRRTQKAEARAFSREGAAQANKNEWENGG